ncbi:hypothetical protein N5D83_20830 [Pseudomonas chengduensis]|nr:hypothetical protein [Pseudomonas chengduensis]MDH1869230.1 hypothetical protein [Pseudomonas chengduensis]
MPKPTLFDRASRAVISALPPVQRDIEKLNGGMNHMSERMQTDTVLFTSTAPQNWCLTRRGDQAWMYLTVIRTDDHSVAGSIDTNDVEKVKESLSSSAENIFVKAIHIVAPTCSGISTVEVLELSEAKLDGSVVFHRLETNFGVTQIDGPVDLLPEQVEQCTFTSLYKSQFGANRCEGLKLCRN